MDNTSTYYKCKCYIHNEKYVLCDICSTLMDYVDDVFETHKIEEFEPIVHAKRWKNKKKQQQKINNLTSDK